ncbi:hypothetical protein G6F70_002931 [Rhizopus microsporus]|nr:hypothetical protein G6F71_002818 [Rhizopus microsporus]KAG1201683.1 hypothetical protein G6F70_002931 [Rhizopus microsporus]KAG1212066.1 hypothetical protein G6F69_004030 [Rhizopus microsporus]KAG1234039.1 hypothetical protein G6F67_003838 [Rhizopus microsporus]KAG1266912.1 hypothetical protein G6F68_002350 [Rhizopus microsporus]
MKIYRAETGQQVNLQSTKDITLLNDLKLELERSIGVPMQSQILMTSFGTQVKESNLKEILEATDQSEYILFCYDRQYLDALPEEISNLLDVETPKLEPRIPAFDGSEPLKSIEKSLKSRTVSQSCESYLSLFTSFDDYSQSLIKTSATHTQLAKVLVDEQKLQRMALNVAMTNLEAHNKSINTNVKAFVAAAEKERTRQSALIQSLQNDLEILKHVRIHPTILHQLNLSHKGKEKLIDFVDQAYIEKVRIDTVKLCDFLSQEIRDMLDKVAELEQCEQEVLTDIANKNNLHILDATLADIQQLYKKAQYLKDTRKRDIGRVSDKIAGMLNIPITNLFASLSIQNSSQQQQQTNNKISHDSKKTLDSFRHLAEYHIQNYLPQLASYEQFIRQKVTTLAISKRNSIQEFIKYMNAVSQIQSEIASIEPRLNSAKDYLDEFKKKYETYDLGSVRDILFGYGALMIEIVRRREYVQLLAENATLLADVMSRYRNEEEQRRDFFRRKISKILPLKMSIMDDSPPQCEITANIPPVTDTTLQKKDIIDFISLLGQAYAQSPSYNRRPLNGSKSLKRLITQQTSEDEKLYSVLKLMYKQLDSLKADFLKNIESDLLGSGSIDSVRTKNASKREDKESQVLSDDEKKIYEAKIQTLERTLQLRSESKYSTSYSLVSNDTASEETKSKLIDTEKRLLEMKDTNERQKQEIDELKKALQKLEQEKNQCENEKEDQRLQIQELEQLLEEERQTYEHNRQSLLNEAKIKDNLADIRIAGLEEDWKGKISDLQRALEEERRTLNELRLRHDAEISDLRFEHDTRLREKVEAINNEKRELALLVDQLREDLASVNQSLEEEREKYEERLTELQTEIAESERAKDEIKLLQQQTRMMVNRAQEDWTMKNEELKRIKEEQTVVKSAIAELLSRYMGEGAQITENTDLEPIIRAFQQNLDQFTAQANLTQENYENLEQEAADLNQRYQELLETHQEWRPIAIGMAEKLEDYRKMMLYEIINQFQIPADEAELNILSRKITPSEDDAAMWNEILQLASSIDHQNITRRLRKRVKEVHELARQYKKDYKELKAKLSEKISFRNFKVGDIALFLPTRNSGGKPWAAFNIGSPYYFLSPTGATTFTTSGSEWIVARITHITEHIVDESDPNPYGLAPQVKYYELEVECWKNQKASNKKKPNFIDSGLASIPVDNRKRPSFMASSSNIVHSTSPPHDALKRRRSATGV